MDGTSVLFHYLTLEDLILIHDIVTKGQDDISRGILSIDALDTCLKAPHCDIFGFIPYDDLMKKGAKMAYEIVNLHPFIDGNKRVAFAAVATLFEMNGLSVIADKKEVVEIMIDVAKGEVSCSDLHRFLSIHTFPSLGQQHP